MDRNYRRWLFLKVRGMVQKESGVDDIYVCFQEKSFMNEDVMLNEFLSDEYNLILIRIIQKTHFASLERVAAPHPIILPDPTSTF
jgi:hypothetical protein